MHNREALYRQIWEHVNRHGIVQRTQRELAVILDIPYQRLCLVFAEFVKTGRMKKYGRATFQMKDPDSFDWAGYADERKEVLT